MVSVLLMDFCIYKHFLLSNPESPSCLIYPSFSSTYAFPATQKSITALLILSGKKRKFTRELNAAGFEGCFLRILFGLRKESLDIQTHLLSSFFGNQ